MQYMHDNNQVRVKVTLVQNVNEVAQRQETHYGANGFRNPGSGELVVMKGEGTVAVYAPGRWESAVTHTGKA